MMEQGKKSSSLKKEEFSSEFGDVNWMKSFEIPFASQNNQKKKKNKPK